MTSSVGTKNPHLEKVNSVFNNPKSLHYYIHHLMKNPATPEAFYQSDQFNKVLKQIDVVYKGKNPFLFRRCGWTPAHVAVICGNETGLKELIKRDYIHIATEDNQTPRDYALKYQPHLLIHFPSLEKRADEKGKDKTDLIQQVKKASVIQVPRFSRSFRYTLGQDFGVEICELLFSCPGLPEHKIKIDHTVKNMQMLSKKLGFKLLLTRHLYYARDSWMCTAKGKRLSFANSLNVPKAIERARSLELYRGKTPFYLTTHCFFKALIGNAYPHIGKAVADYKHLMKNVKPLPALPTFRFYLEGGNHFCITNAQGKPILLLGGDMVAIMHNQFRLDNIFETLSIDLKLLMEDSLKKLTSDEDLLRNTLLEMYAQGLLRVPGKTGPPPLTVSDIQMLVSHFEAGSVKKEHSYLQLAIDKGCFVPLSLPKDLERYKPIAATYLAQRVATLAIAAESFSVEQQNVFIIPQLFYHLDVFLRPGPKGSFFTFDFSKTLECLGAIESNQDKFQLSKKDKEILQEYIETTQTLKQQLGHLQKQTLLKLHAAGCYCLFVPGLFLGKSAPSLREADIFPTNHVNFFNAITGWSSKTGKQYYITGGAGVGDRLGIVLQDVFEASLKHYCPDIDVHFVGYDPAEPTNFAEAHRLLNTYGQQSGVHCLSFEWSTVPRKA